MIYYDFDQLGPEWATEEADAGASFGTWHLANGADTGISWNEPEFAEQTRPCFPVLGGFRQRNAMQGYVRRPYNRRNNPQNTPFFEPPKDSREVYWCSTGPKTETKRMMGHTLELPVIAPSSAPPEDKKLILTQTRDRIAEVSPGDWPAKTHLLAQRFIVAVPNAANEAKVRLQRMKDWTSNVFNYSPPIGLQGNLNFTDLANTTVLRYLSFEIHIQPRNAPTPELPVPGLPGERTIEAIMKVPLNALGTDVHPICTPQNLMNPRILLRDMKQVGIEIQMGKRSSANTFDPATFDKEFQTILSECMFSAVEAILNRDYIGKGITQDIQKRLRDCRQVIFHQGRYRVKTVTEQHADFMRLVQEFDVDEHIPANLPNIAFHNLAKNIQAEMINQKYEPPTECHTTAEQYQKLAEFHEKALEAERKLNQMETMVKRFSGINKNNNATAFMARITPEDAFLANDEDDIWAENPYNNKFSTLANQNAQLKTMLSVAERAIRRASGELAPIECWGCKDLPEYSNDKFHRYRFCPRRNDPKVKANFDKNLREWTSKKRQGHPFRTQELGAQYNRSPQFEPAPKRTHLTIPLSPDQEDQPQLDDGIQDVTNQLGQVSAETDLLMEFGISQETNQIPTRLPIHMTTIIRNSTPKQNKENIDPSTRITDAPNKYTPDWSNDWNESWSIQAPSTSKQMATDQETSQNFLQRYTGKQQLPTSIHSEKAANILNNSDNNIQAAIILCNLKTTSPNPTWIIEKPQLADSPLKTHTQHPERQNFSITTQSFRVTRGNNNSPHYKNNVLNQPQSIPTPFPTYRNQKAPLLLKWKTSSPSPSRKENTSQIQGEDQRQNLPPEAKKTDGTRTHHPDLVQENPTTIQTKEKFTLHNFSLFDRTKLYPRNRKIMKLFCPANMSVPRGPHNEPHSLNTPPRFPTVNPPIEPNEEITEILNEWSNEPRDDHPTSNGIDPPVPQDLSVENPEDSEAINILVDKALTIQDTDDPEHAEWQKIFQTLQDDRTPATSRTGSEESMKGTGMKPDIGQLIYTAPDLECKEWRALATEAVKFQITAIGELLVPHTNIEPGVTNPLALISHPLPEHEEGMAILPAKGEPSIFMASLEDHILRGSLGFEVNNSEAAHDIIQLLVKHGYLDGLADADLWCHTGHGLLRICDSELEMTPDDLLSQHHWDIRWAMFEGALLQEGACNIEIAMLKSPEDPDCSAEAALRRIRARNKLELEDKSTCGQTLRAAIASLTEEPDIKERVKAVLPLRPATKCMVTKLTSNRKVPLEETASTDGSGKSDYESDDSMQEVMKKLASNEVPRTLWKHEPRQFNLQPNDTILNQQFYKQVSPTHPSHCHTHFHLPPGFQAPQIQQLHPLGVWSFPHIFGYSHESDSPEDIKLQSDLARKKDEEFDVTFDEEFNLAQFLTLDKADRGNQEVSAIEQDLAHLLLNWNLARNKEDTYRKLIGNDHLPAAEQIIKQFESEPHPILGESYVGTTPLLIPLDISPACWIQMKKAHHITQADLCLAISLITHQAPFLFIDVIKARKIRDWQRARSAMDMFSEALKNAGYSPIFAKTCLQEFSKSLEKKSFIGQLKVHNTTLHPDPVTSNHDPPLIQLSDRAKLPLLDEKRFGRQALDTTRKEHLENLNNLAATWHTGPGKLDYVKVAINFGTERLPLFFLLDNGSPKSILNLETIQITARTNQAFSRLATYIKENAKKVPTLRHQTGWEVKSAIPLRLTWHEYNSEDTDYDDADDVVEPFGITANIPGLECHGIIGRDFLQKFYATCATGDTSNSSLITICPYWGRSISTSSVDPTQSEIRDPLTQRINIPPTKENTISNTDSVSTVKTYEPGSTTTLRSGPTTPKPQPEHSKPHKPKQYVSIWNGRSWKKEAQLLKAHNIRIVDQAVFTSVPPALSESPWNHIKPREVYTLPSTVTIDPTDYALIDTDFIVSNETPTSAIIVLKLTNDPQTHCTIRPQPTPPQQVTGAFITTKNGLRWLMVKIRNNSDHPWTVSQKLIGKVEVWQPPDRKSWHMDIADGERRSKIIRQNKEIEPQISDDENNSHVCVYNRSTPKKRKIRPPTPFRFDPSQDKRDEEDMSYSTEPSKISDSSYNMLSDETTAPLNSQTSYSNTASQSTEDYMSTDSEEGYDTTGFADTLRDLSFDVSRTKETSYSRSTSSIQIQTQPGRPKKRKHTRTPACLGFIRVNQSVMKKKVFPVATTEMLPHILFPVGEAEPGSPWQKLTTIRGLLDTGSGVNIGYKPYWESVAAQYPKLVKEFGQLDPDDHEELTVGGIEKSGEGTSCSHFIILKTPFFENGNPIELRIALTDGLSCNLIFGLPFIVKSKMVINVWEKYVVSPVFQASFPLLYHPPELRESVVAQDATTPVLKASSTDE